MTRFMLRILVAVVCLGFMAAPCANAQRFRDRPAPLAEAMAADAALRDLSMVDATHGWAVGDRGVIWFTEDGGRRWLRQNAPTTASLSGVSFVDNQHGWAVGGVTIPYTHSTRAVVLHTSNGGYSWEELPTALLPGLRGVRFFSRQRGIAWGQGGPLSPSGMFHTRDGGRHWETVHAEQQSSWLAAAFVDDRSGIAVSGDGKIAEYASGSLTPLRTNNARPHRTIVLSRDGRGCIAGGGSLLTTSDLGQRWTPANFPTDFNTDGLAQLANNLWAVGSPGTAVLHSSDHGAAWQAQPSGVRTALAAVQFIDPKNGWAVGGLGTILATQDGGRTWITQRQGGERCAVLVLSPTSEDLPLELVAKLGAGEGYLTAAVALFANPLDGAAEQDRFRQAAIGAGATVAEVAPRFPLTPSKRDAAMRVLAECLDDHLKNDASGALQSYLASLLDQHRPDVVLIAPSAYRGAGQLLESALMKTVQQTSQRTSQQSTDTSRWRPRRVLRLHAGPTMAASGVTTTDFQAQLNTSLKHWAAPYQGLLTQRARPAVEQFAWTPLAGGAPTGDRGDPLAGLVIEHGGPARRTQTQPPASGLAALKALSLKNEQLETLLTQTTPGPDWAGQTLRLTGGLDEDTGAQLLTELAAEYRRRGAERLAVDTSYLLARRYPNHPLAEHALRSLVNHYASVEKALCAQQGGNHSTLDISLNNPDRDARSEDAAQNQTLPEHLERALKLGDYLEQAMPTVYADPQIAFPLAAACRRLEQEDLATQLLAGFLGNSASEDWRRCAELEAWLDKRERNAPKPTLAAQTVTDRPMLDGLLDEPFWETAATAELLDSNHPDTAQVRIAYDDEFLYLAIDAQKLPGAAYPSDRASRPRDADLRGYDRVALRLDTNRDYATALELTVDCRGWTHDRCDQLATWNPRWYVASQTDEERWRVEAAIPLKELSLTPPTTGAAWALNAERLAPGRLTRTWTAPHADGSPDAYGVLLFE